MRPSASILRCIDAASALAAAAFAACVGLGVANASAADDRKTLRAVSLLFRHDLISPKYDLPKLGAKWPMGFEQLTALGIQRTYAAGQALRRKYVEELGLIAAHYRAEDIYFRSSNTDRALQTAQVLALGLFPLGTGPDPSVFDKRVKAIPTPELAFAPVPVHSVALQHDNVMRPWTRQAACTKILGYLNSLPDTQLYRAQAKRFAPFLLRLASLTGHNEGKKPAKILFEINEISEPVIASVDHNKPLPKEITEKDIEVMARLSDWNYHYYFLGKKVGRLTGGSFVGEVLGNFTRFINAPEKARKMHVYTGHQRTMLGVEAALGIETARANGPFHKGRIPPLGSQYAFELHERAEGAYAVRLKFIADGAEKVIAIPGCDGEFCAFDRFKSVTAEVIPDDWRAECNS